MKYPASQTVTVSQVGVKKKNQIWYLKWGSPMTLKAVKQQKKQEDLLSYFNVSEDKIHCFFKAQLTVQIIISSIFFIISSIHFHFECVFFISPFNIYPRYLPCK